MEEEKSIIRRELNGHIVPQRQVDGYINLSKLCEAGGKKLADWNKLKSTKAYLEALSSDMNILISSTDGSNALIVYTNARGEQSTWGHPEVAVDVGKWVSVEFRIMVNRWFVEWSSGKLQEKEEQKVPTMGEVLQTMVTAYQQHEERLLAVEEDSVAIKRRLAEQQETLESTVMLAEANANELQRFKNGHGYWYSVVGYMEKHGMGSRSAKQAAALGRKAAALCKQMGIAPEKVNDPRFGTVNTYPEHILAEII